MKQQLIYFITYLFVNQTTFLCKLYKKRKIHVNYTKTIAIKEQLTKTFSIFERNNKLKVKAYDEI